MDFFLGLFVGFNAWLFVVLAVCLILSFASAFREDVCAVAGTIIFSALLFSGVAWVTGADPTGLKALFTWKNLFYYLLIGLGWATFKWTLLVLRWKKCFRYAFSQFAEKNDIPDTPAAPLSVELRAALAQFLDNDSSYWRHTTIGSLKRPPQPRDHAHRIGAWFIWWPFSALWTLLGDGILWAYKLISRLISGLLRGINKVLLGGYDNNLKGG